MRHSAIFFTVMSLIVFGLTTIYLARRSAFALGIAPARLYALYALLFAGSFTLVWTGRLSFATHEVIHILCMVSVWVSGFLLCLLAATLFADGVRLVLHLHRQAFGLLALGTAIVLFGVGTWNAATPRLKTLRLQMPNLQKGVRLVQLTDIHLGHMRGKKHLEGLVNLTNEARPDIVVITGDLFDAEYNLTEETLSPLARITAPVYFVEGNHDIYTGSPRIKQMLRSTGVHVLENEAVMTDCGVRLIGLDYLSADRQTKDNMHVPSRAETIESVLRSIPRSEQATIGLHHNPVGARYFAEAGVSLYLSGHTHGGQFYPLIWFNDREFEYNRGPYRYEGMYIYVSCGSGTTGPALRLGTRPEVTLFLLEPAER